MPNLSLDVLLKGKLWSARIPSDMHAFVQEAKRDVAQEGVDLIHIQLDRVLQNPTGYYDSQIQTRNVADDVVITDGGVVYGGWLEGVSSRNQSTRFKGYHTFRLVAQDLKRTAADIAAKTLTKYITGRWS